MEFRIGVLRDRLFFQLMEFGVTGPNGNNATSRAEEDGNCARAYVTTRSMVELRVPEVTKTGRSATTTLVQVRFRVNRTVI